MIHTAQLQDVKGGSNPLVCSACDKFAGGAITYLSEEQTQDNIRELLRDACSRSLSMEHKVITFFFFLLFPSYNHQEW
jgi:hypothetical protein